jgi:Receptor family ligand binding region
MFLFFSRKNVPAGVKGNTTSSSSSSSANNNNDSNATAVVGFSHMAAAFLAMEHFNARNASVVPQLANLSTSSCNVWFDMDASNVYDTQSFTHKAAISLVNSGGGGATTSPFPRPCAIAGPYSDLPARDLSILALSYQIPQVAHRVFDPLFTHAYYSPYSLSVFPDTRSSSAMLVDYLVQSKNRTNFIGILYSRTAISIYKKESLTESLTKFGIRWMASPYVNPDINGPIPGLDALTAMTRILQSGYRTIIISTENNDAILDDVQAIADAAEALQMNSGDYFYVFQDLYAPQLLNNSKNNMNANISKLLAGSGTVFPLTNAMLYPKTDPFYLAWTSQGKQQVDRANAANPIAPGEPGYYFAEDDFFQTVPLEFGAPWMFDAVMSIGIAACQAVTTNTTTNTTQEVAAAAPTNGTSTNITTTNSNTIITSQNHLNSLLQVNFTGATGNHMEFSPLPSLQGRLFSSLNWIGLNLLPPVPASSNEEEEEEKEEFIPYSKTDLYLAKANQGIITVYDHNIANNNWESLETFYFRDSRTVPPDLLRDQPEQNYLSDGLRITGFILLGIVWAFALVSVIWVFLRRQHRVLKASQPFFLYLLAFSAVIEASAILPISFDESHGWNAEQLGSACMAIPWYVKIAALAILAMSCFNHRSHFPCRCHASDS